MAESIIGIGDKVTLIGESIQFGKSYVPRGCIGEVVNINSDKNEYCVEFPDKWFGKDWADRFWLKPHRIKFHSKGTPEKQEIQRTTPKRKVKGFARNLLNELNYFYLSFKNRRYSMLSG